MKPALVLVLVVASIFPCFAGETGLQELTGILAKGQKSLCVNILKLDGAENQGWRASIMDLKADDLMDSVPDGARIWVKGEIKTELFERKLDPGAQCGIPTHWHIYMVVKEYAVIEKPFQRPKEKESQNRAPQAIGAPQSER